MKKFVSMFLAVVMIVSMFAAMQSPAYADDLVNKIKGSSDSSESSGSSYGPSASDILATSNGRKIQLPQSTSYFDDYEVMYITAPKKLAAFVYTKPNTSSAQLEYAYQGSKVIVLAEESGLYCILYTTSKNERKAGWINKAGATTVFPGDSYDFGKKKWLTDNDCVNYGDAYISWSKSNFVGTKIKYTVIDELPSDLTACRGLTIEYKITGRGTNDDRNREIYINYGDGWESYGTFTIDKNLSPVRLNFYFEKPATVKGVAVIPTDPDNYDFSFRQTVVDVMYDYSYSPGAWQIK